MFLTEAHEIYCERMQQSERDEKEASTCTYKCVASALRKECSAISNIAM